MSKYLPLFCGIAVTTKEIIEGSVVENHQDGYAELSLTGNGLVSVVPKTSFEIISHNGDGDEVFCNSVAMHMPDMPDGCFVALDESAICGSMFVGGDKSGFIIYALVYHDGGIKSKVLYSTFHKDGHVNDLKKYTPYPASKLHEIEFVGRYVGEDSIQDVVVKKQWAI